MYDMGVPSWRNAPIEVGKSAQAPFEGGETVAAPPPEAVIPSHGSKLTSVPVVVTVYL